MFKRIFFIISTVILLACLMQSCTNINEVHTPVTPEIGSYVTPVQTHNTDIDDDDPPPEIPTDIDDVEGCVDPTPYTLKEFYNSRKKDDYFAFVRIKDIFPQIESVEDKVTAVIHSLDSRKYLGYFYSFGDDPNVGYGKDVLVVSINSPDDFKEISLSEYFSNMGYICVDDISKINETNVNKSIAVIRNIENDEIAYMYSDSQIIRRIYMKIADGVLMCFRLPGYYQYPEKYDNWDEIREKDPCYDLILKLMGEGPEREQVYNAIKKSVLDNVEYGNPTIK